MSELLHSRAETDEARPLTWRPLAIERQILCVLDARPALGEQIAVAFGRKEIALRSLFAGMSLADARELLRRLSLSLPDDPIATGFARLVSDRRARLLSFLGDARRRRALGVAK